jgi:hypothetical protein
MAINCSLAVYSRTLDDLYMRFVVFRVYHDPPPSILGPNPILDPDTGRVVGQRPEKDTTPVCIAEARAYASHEESDAQKPWQEIPPVVVEFKLPPELYAQLCDLAYGALKEQPRVKDVVDLIEATTTTEEETTDVK